MRFVLIALCLFGAYCLVLRIAPALFMTVSFPWILGGVAIVAYYIGGKVK